MHRLRGFARGFFSPFRGALAGMVGGGLLSLLWPSLIAPLGGVFAIYELLPAFIFSSLLIVGVSLADKAPDQAVLNEFERARSSESLNIIT